MPAIACVDGVFSAPEAALVPAEDRGFVFGDGVYETMLCYNGRIWALDRHWKRFENSLKAIFISTNCLPQAREWMLEAHRRSELQDALIYVQITRGTAPRAHAFTPDLRPTVFITVRPPRFVLPEQRENGVAVITTPDLRWARRDIKTINLLPNVLAKQQAQLAGAFEAIMVEPDGRVTEGSSTNLFAVFDGAVWTAPADHHILGGITRDLVLAVARDHRITVHEEPFSVERLRQANELFLSGTTVEVLGITRLDGATVGSGRVGEVTRALFAGFSECLRLHKDCL